MVTYWLPKVSILFDIVRIWWPRFNAIILKSKNFFSFFCSISWNYIKFWTFWRKRWSSYLLYFGNYRLQKTWLDHSLKNTVSEDPLTVNIWKGPKLFKILMGALSLYFESLWENQVWNIRALVACWIFGLLGDILTPNERYPVREYENLLTPVQIQVSWVQKAFSDFFVLFLETILNFEHFEKKEDRDTYFISENTDCQRLG